jgi:pilus assembly protein CpaE
VRIVLAVGSDKQRQRLVKMLQAAGHEVESSAGGSTLASLTADAVPDLIICDEELKDDSGHELVKRLRKTPVAKQLPVLLLVGAKSRLDQLRIALEVGANDAIDRRAGGVELTSRIQQLASRGEEGRPSRLANTVTIVGARGGSGKTVLACNLAVAIARYSGETVALLDLNLEFGTAATMLSLHPNATLSQIARAAVEEPTDEAFDAMLLHHSSGLRLLPALAQPGDSELLKDESVSALLARLRRTYDHLIIDGRPSYREFMIELWDNSDSLVVPCVADVPSVAVTQALLSAFDRVDVLASKIVVVVNDVIPKAGLSAAQIQRFLSRQTVSVPYGGEDMQNSVNKGRPYILDHPGEPTGVAIRDLADHLLSIYAAGRQGA